MELADRKGIEALSMRKLASALGVEAMSLYHHVSSRESLLDLMVDCVFAELSEQGFQAPARPEHWKAWMMDASGRMRTVLRNHPWSVGLLDSRRNPGPATLSYQNERLGRLREAGFSVDMAAHAVAVQDSFVYGFVLQELALPFENGTDLGELVEEIRTTMPDGQYPHLEEMMHDLVGQEGYSFSREFEFGLNLMIDGLEAKLAREKG
ncbi:MAG: TetR/AcrR family transcriptional regulator C-terminal domain-containing protein [Leptospiraceae bacterium]|nr:TetR/AcrR family transcriptional regulator C-terminal domain-containing protein [Leptospiraceae bacterium]